MELNVTHSVNKTLKTMLLNYVCRLNNEPKTQS